MANPKPRRQHPAACHRHPGGAPASTGLCPACLRERLSQLSPSSAAAPPELRRCKTFSGKNGESVMMSFEPRRRSCDVRSSLSNLFHLDDDEDGLNDVVRVESRNLGLLGRDTCPLPEEEEEEVECESQQSNCEFEISRVSDFRNVVEDEEDEFEDSKTTMKEFIDLEFESKNAKSSSNNNSNRRDFKEIAGSFWVAASVFSKKLRKWKKKQRNSREPNYDECDDNGVGLGEMQLEKLRGRRLMSMKMKSLETQSEVGFGRRSCDTDPRGSIDLGRASIDGFAFGRVSCDTDPRFSVDLGRASVDLGRTSVDLGRASVDCGVIEDRRRCDFEAPRASWDGYLSGGGPPRPVVSVIENAMATVYGFDHHRMLAGIKTTRLHSTHSPQTTRFESLAEHHRMLPGVKTTRLDIAKDSHTTRFESLDDHHRMLDGLKTTRLEPINNAQTTRFESLARTSSINLQRKETLEKPSPNPNTRVSPTTSAIKLLITEKELNEWRLNSHSHSNSHSLKDDNSSESFETASKDLTSFSSSSSSKDVKKCRQWSKLFSFWGLLKPRKEDKCSKDNPHEYECPRASSAENYIRNGSDSGFDPDWKLPRSHSTASSRKIESNSNTKALVLDRNRSARYSPNHHFDNGLLRFYLTPLRSRSRRRSKLAKGKLKNSRSLARSVLRL